MPINVNSSADFGARYDDALERNGDALVIGVVNNMPDAALRNTERQFRELLLAAAAGRHAVRIRWFSLPELPRSAESRAHLSESYENLDALGASPLDGLIVTGTEPRADRLEDEPYWPTLTHLIDWAEENVTASVWSCLAAHAAVLHRDGIQRRRMSAKLSGVFACSRAADHALVADAPARWWVPHSRYNDLPAAPLAAYGYRILAVSAAAGVDLFVRDGASLAVYLQGHPEYEPDALLREYRRDLRRFLTAERDDYPEIPRGYFAPAMEASLVALRLRAERHRTIDLMADFPAAALEAQLNWSWRADAVRLYTNWLRYLSDHRSRDHALEPPADGPTLWGPAGR